MQDHCEDQEELKRKLRPITGGHPREVDCSRAISIAYPRGTTEMNRNKDVGGFFGGCGVSNNNMDLTLSTHTNNSSNNNFFSDCGVEPLDINVRNLENLSLMDNFSSSTAISGLENNENLVYFQDFDSVLNSYIDDPKEGNISRTVRVPSSEHVAEIVGRQGCKIKDLRARTNTYIKTPMRTQSPVFVVTGKEEAVLHVMEEIQNAAEHFTHIRASRNQHKSAGGNGLGSGGLEANKPASREGDIMIQVTVPYRVVGLVVGLKGQTIKAIQQDTDTFIVTPNRDKAPIFEIRGQPENVERAKAMILRHIETRTRHCRLQDNTNLPGTWSSAAGLDETTHGGSSSGSGSGGMADFSIFQHHNIDGSSNNDGVGSSSLNGHHHNGLMSNNYSNNNHTFSSSNGSMGGNRQYGSSLSASVSPPANSNYSSSWGGYTGMFDQHTNQQQSHGHNAGGTMAWSSATSDFGPMINGDNDATQFGAVSSHHSLSSSLRSPHNNFQALMSSSSNSSASVSPPHEFMNDSLYSGNQQGMSMAPFGASMGASPPLNSLLQDNSPDAADFTGFPLLSNGSSSPGFSKGSLVLGNLFRSSNSGASSSSLVMHMLSGSSNSSTSSVGSNNGIASPTSSDGFHRGESAAGAFSAGGSGTAASAPPVCSLGASSSSCSSSSSFAHMAESGMFAGAGGLDGGGVMNGSSLLSGGEGSPTTSRVPVSTTSGEGSQGSPTPRLCKVCEEAEVVAALVPCGHNLFCMACAEAITSRPIEADRKCPVCDEKAVNVLRIRA